MTGRDKGGFFQASDRHLAQSISGSDNNCLWMGAACESNIMLEMVDELNKSE